MSLSNDNITTATILSADRVTNLVDIKTVEFQETIIQQNVDEPNVPDPEHSQMDVTPNNQVTQQIETLNKIPLPDPWSPYYAGDRVEAIRLQVCLF